MVSPRPLLSLLARVRVSAGHRALLPHIPGVAGDGHLVNLDLNQEMHVLTWFYSALRNKTIYCWMLMGKNVINKITETVIKNTFG